MRRVSEEITEVPLLEQVQVKNQPLPLWHAHWRLLVDTAFQIRQHVSKPMQKGGLEFILTQHENTQRGIETLRGILNYKDFITEKNVGVETWLKRLCTHINLKINGYKPIERLQRVRTNRGFFAYYGSFMADQMEIIIYVGSGEDIDGATVVHLERSYVDEATRDWSIIADYLPQTVWVNQTTPETISVESEK